MNLPLTNIQTKEVRERGSPDTMLNERHSTNVDLCLVARPPVGLQDGSGAVRQATAVLQEAAQVLPVLR